MLPALLLAAAIVSPTPSPNPLALPIPMPTRRPGASSPHDLICDYGDSHITVPDSMPPDVRERMCAGVKPNVRPTPAPPGGFPTMSPEQVKLSDAADAICRRRGMAYTSGYSVSYDTLHDVQCYPLGMDKLEAAARKRCGEDNMLYESAPPYVECLTTPQRKRPRLTPKPKRTAS